MESTTQGSEPALAGHGHAWRHLGFVTANTTLVGGLSLVMWRAIPPLREIPWLTLVPVNGLALVAFLVLYPVLRRQRPGLSRLLSLYFAFVSVFAAYGLFLSVAFPIGPNLSIVGRTLGSISLGHFYGMPVLFTCGLMNALLSHAFFPRAAGAMP